MYYYIRLPNLSRAALHALSIELVSRFSAASAEAIVSWIDDLDVGVRTRIWRNAEPRAIFQWKKGETVGRAIASFEKERRQEDARESRYHRPQFTHIESASASAFLRTCAHACAAYRRPRIRDNVIDDDIERRSSRSRAFQRSELLPLSPRCGRETSFPINSCTDANGRLSPLDINDGWRQYDISDPYRRNTVKHLRRVYVNGCTVLLFSQGYLGRCA